MSAEKAENTQGLTRRQIRELRGTPAADVVGADVVPEVDAAATPTAEPVRFATKPDSGPVTIAAGIVMHSAPVVRGPRPAMTVEPVPVASAQTAKPEASEPVEPLPSFSRPQIQPIRPIPAAAEGAIEAPPAVSATTPVLAGRRALRASRVVEVSSEGVVDVVEDVVDAPEEVAPAAAVPVQTASISRREARNAAVTKNAASEESVPSPAPAVVAHAAPAENPRPENLFAGTTDEEPLAGDVLAQAEWESPSELTFDEIIAARPRGAVTSASSTTLIFNPGDVQSALTGPIPATGEMLITASHAIAPGLASRGHVDGTVDDKSADSVLVDGELPAASSPTPVAASSAISRKTQAPEMVRPAEPEKTNRATVALVVTGGLLLVAALATLIVGLMTGALS